MAQCEFCSPLPKVLQNDLAFTVYDINPVSQGHTLIIPRRHVATFMEFSPLEWGAMFKLIVETQSLLQNELAPDGFNLFVSSGKAAGQKITHAHIHFIPRYKGQVVRISEELAAEQL